MFTEGIFPIGDGLLDIDEDKLKGLLVPHDINEIYDVEQTPFARGKFAAVRRAVHRNSGVHFAAKFLKRRRRAQSSDKEIKHEIAVLMLCDGADNIVKLNAVHETRSDTALLLELATGGELQTFLDNEECLSEAQARICMREVLKALQFLHKRSIAHLDLKPQNILLTGERIEDGLKLCDFGISRVVAEGTNVREIVGTPDYVAPEVLQYEPLSLLTDIWSVGVLAYVLLSGFSPFGGETKQETFLNISQCSLTFPDKLFGGVSGAAIDFIRRSLRIKPNDRMTAAGCLEHIWLKDECSIDRQLFSNISKKSTTDASVDLDIDLEVDEDEEEEEEDEDEEDVEDDVENIDDEDDISTEENNVSINGINNLGSSDTEILVDQRQVISNSKMHKNSNGSNTNGISYIHANGTNVKHCETNLNGSTKTSTAILTVPATRATTIPLCSMQQAQHQQQQLHIARRHSSDSNKENTFLATKKIIPANLINGSSKSPTTTTTATIIIESSDKPPALPTTTNSTVVTTITLPNGSSKTDKNGQAQCLFPDAPTTPKVIRKAPTADTSPTSVKALVKKFQLEGNNCTEKPTLHLKEAQVNHYHQAQQQQQQPQPHQHINGISTAKSTTTTTTPTLNGKATGNTNCFNTPDKPITHEHKKSYSHSISNNSNGHSSTNHM
ncbi:death-associated protein kinase related-like, partial [Teleopsis dalmanni]|uniref:death-associated protein kinase related-like n=1 Tax=Teleopsis dalmanni TaxID=139649 RepID=UPI0018CD837A